MRTRTHHACAECGVTSPRWTGRCPGCGEWNTLHEVTDAAPTDTATVCLVGPVDAAEPVATGVEELDRVLGGGVVRGSTTLLFGEPGIGKSTLALMALRQVGARGLAVLLVAAEESAAQVARRARRLGVVPDSLEVCVTGDVAVAEAVLRERRPVLCVVDSVSAMGEGALALAGSVTQVRHAAGRLCAAAKDVDSALVLVGHVTKDGELAGPRALEHLVDTVVRIEGDRDVSLRIVRALKHRFGATGEVGLLEMEAGGLRSLPEAGLRGPRRGPDVAGVVFTVTNDGSRSFLVEVQALVASSAGSPRRVAHQVSAQRLALMLAVLEARCGIDLAGLDVFAASAGGLAATEPSVDVALALAVATAHLGVAVPRTMAFVGEVGLAGELRTVSGLARRVREARRLGATTIVVPALADVVDAEGIEVVACDSLAETLALVRA